MRIFKRIEEWLEIENPQTYDFVESTQKEKAEDYGCIENSYEKFLVYRYDSKINWGIIEKRNGIFRDIDEYITRDPDTSSYLLQDIYKELWPELAEQEFMKRSKKWICSDTMTSAARRFQDALGIIINEEIEPKRVNLGVSEQIRKIHDNCKKVLNLKRQEWWSTNFSILVAAGLGEEFYKLIDENYSNMAAFLNKNHTIGNFCPVPKGFNSARAGGGNYDYWDITLMKIREWYISIDSKSLYERDKLIYEDLLHNTGNSLACLRWLECFGQGQMGWHNFVDTLFMQDYVWSEDNKISEYKVSKDDDMYYKVIPFWDGHSWEKPKLTDDLKDEKNNTVIVNKINERLKEINRRVDARSDRIVDACNAKLMK